MQSAAIWGAVVQTVYVYSASILLVEIVTAPSPCVWVRYWWSVKTHNKWKPLPLRYLQLVLNYPTPFSVIICSSYKATRFEITLTFSYGAVIYYQMMDWLIGV